MTTELSDLLRRAAEPIAERDFVDGAFAGARARRRRNRWAALAATATVAAAAVAVTTIPGLSRDGATVPAGTPTVWSAAPFDLLGVKAIEGPAPLKMSQIPNTSDDLRTRWQLPSRLDFDASTPMAPLSSVEGNSAPVRAVMLRSTGEGQFQPVLYRPDLPTPFILVDSLTLTSNLDESGNAADPLAVRAISADRRRVAFVQRGKVLVLDAVTGETKPYPVPDNRLIDGGWVEGSETLLASSETHQWRINTTTGQVNSIAAGYAGPDRLVVTGDGTNVFRHYDAQGLPAGGCGPVAQVGPGSARRQGSFTHPGERPFPAARGGPQVQALSMTTPQSARAAATKACWRSVGTPWRTARCSWPRTTRVSARAAVRRSRGAGRSSCWCDGAMTSSHGTSPPVRSRECRISRALSHRGREDPQESSQSPPEPGRPDWPTLGSLHLRGQGRSV